MSQHPGYTCGSCFVYVQANTIHACPKDPAMIQGSALNTISNHLASIASSLASIAKTLEDGY